MAHPSWRPARQLVPVRVAAKVRLPVARADLGGKAMAKLFASETANGRFALNAVREFTAAGYGYSTGEFRTSERYFRTRR